MNPQNPVLITIIVLLIISITPVSAFNYNQLSNATHDLYKEEGIRVSVTQLPNHEFLKYDFVNNFLYLVNSQFTSIYQKMVLVRDNHFENVIDGNNKTGVFATVDDVGEYHVYKKFDAKDWDLLVLNIEDNKNQTNVYVMNHLKELCNTKPKSINTTNILDLTTWLSYHMDQYQRMHATNMTWDELQPGMIAILKQNETFYPCIIKQKNIDNIYLQEGKNPQTFIMPQTDFTEVYTGVALCPIVDQKQIPLHNISKETLVPVLSYLKNLFNTLYDYIITKNPYITALEVSLNLWKNYGIYSQVYQLDTNAMLKEAPYHKGTLLLMHTDDNNLFFVTLKGINDNSIIIQDSPYKNGEMTLTNFEKYYTGITIFCDGNFELSNLFIFSNKLINDINTPEIPKKSTWEKIKEITQNVVSYPFTWYVDHIPGRVLDAAISVGTMVLLIAVSGMKSGKAALTFVGIFTAITAFGAIAHGICDLIHTVQRNKDYKELKKKYGA